ncbi:GerMN domain-containing protein [Pontibacillus litoralis]|uniref:Germination protein n=1 Tax=Pontibacillus litoralis JSM 072002 TaxID=1385512 RepID=A0A0A5HZM6_9BACI|nr:GerMN domain-containing protein [Pontibacillus litoralis]KGX89037.1 germination protein [Pontibacillus litoralis JSM 072002]
MQKQIIFVGLLMSIALLTGCVFQGEQSLEEMDVPQEQKTEEANVPTSQDAEEGMKEEELDEEGIEEAEGNATVDRQLYLLDEEGMVVPQTVAVPMVDSKEVAKQSLEYLVKDGPVTELLPNGFQAVLPAGTQFSLNLLEDGTVVVDVSKEFEDYRAEDELKVLQAMTYTLTQFDSIERLKLQINGHDTDVMPVNGTPVAEGYSRANGINLEIGDVMDLTDSDSVTVYYPSQHNDQLYYIPVTKRVDVKESKKYETIVETLINGPGYNNTGLLTVFNQDVKLIAEPDLENGVLTLTFNENVLNDFDDKSVVTNKVMESLVLSLTEQPEVEAVSVKVENKDKVFTEKGVELAQPVTRGEISETGSF